MVFIFLQGVTSKSLNACLASQRIITVLETVPYKLHSFDLQSAVYTINTLYNVQCTVFDTPAGTYTPIGAIHLVFPPTNTNASALDVDIYNGLREYNLFTMTMPYPNTIQGSSNWMVRSVAWRFAFCAPFRPSDFECTVAPSSTF